jgi:hypothetical protein
MRMHNWVATALLAFAVACIAPSAMAGVITCEAAIQDKVEGSLACERSTSASQDFLNVTPITVNQEAFFGFTDWIFESRTELGDGVQAGLYDVGNLLNLHTDVMLIFKDGNDTFLVGYLLGQASGSWSTPFIPGVFNVMSPRDVSHISVYARGVSVPEPGTIALLGGGLLGMAWIRRRRPAA